MQSLKEFAAALAQAKRGRHITATELAERTGLSPQAVRQMLAGKTAPRLTNAMALAQELGLELVLMPSEAANSLSQPRQTVRTVVSDVERLIAASAPGVTRVL